MRAHSLLGHMISPAGDRGGAKASETRLKMACSWFLLAVALSLCSLPEGKSADLVLLTDAPTQSVS